jgi:hypothetical protein
MKWLTASLVCVMLASAASAAEIGKLFYSPAERAQLDEARSQKKAPPVATAPQPEEAPVPQVVTYSGLVRRSDGRSLLWLNGRLVDEKEALAGPALKGTIRPDGAVILQARDSAESVSIKVGQSAELQSGKVAERAKIEAQQKAAAKDAAKDAAQAAPQKEPPLDTNPNSAEATPPRASNAADAATRGSASSDRPRETAAAAK